MYLKCKTLLNLWVLRGVRAANLFSKGGGSGAVMEGDVKCVLNRIVPLMISPTGKEV